MAEDKARSMRALDALNFCNAGIQTGLGPFQAIFYTAVRQKARDDSTSSKEACNRQWAWADS
jgi:hypothetical protein